ncbi:PAS domain S-box protein [Nisaea denitrificans]|uniref:PAS domain S-box protein n=1 Tax=Nisaea denitrificans TaxID=390877 RepID=UPI000414CE10|nr:PAS domain S-box protein [Nisaea denitrificans]
MHRAFNRKSDWRICVGLPAFVGAVFALHGGALGWFLGQAISGPFWILEQAIVVTAVTGLAVYYFLHLRSGVPADGSAPAAANSLPEITAWGHAERIGQIGYWYWTLDGDDIFWSDGAFRILDLDRATTTAKWNSFLLSVHPEERDEIHRWFRQAWKIDSESATECRILRPDGSVRSVEARMGPLFENGRKTAVCGTLMDVTERVERLNEIQILNNDQEELVEQRTAELRAEISKRKAIQAELEFSEEKHRNTIDSAADAIISVDPDGRITSANQAVETIFGFSLKTLVGQPVTVLMDASMADVHQSWVQRFLETGKSSIIGRTTELEGRRADGALFPIELSVSEVSTAGSRSFTAIIRDITKRKLAERETQRNAERLREILEFCPMGVSIFSVKDLRRLFMNHRNVELSGFRDPESGGEVKIEDTFVDGVFPKALRDRIVAGEDVSAFEVERVRADGSRWWSLLSAKRIDFEGVPSVIAWQSDITERRKWEKMLLEKEEQLRSTINNAPAGIILTDEHMKIVVANDQLRDILDVPREMMEPGCDYTEIIRYVAERGDYGPEADRTREVVLSSLVTPTARPFEYTSRAGKAFSVRRHPVGDGSVVTIAVDVTEQKQAEERLRQALWDLELAQDELVQAEKMASLGGLVAGVAHEINTPIGTALTASTHVREETLKIGAAFESNAVKRSQLEGYLSIADEGSRIIESNLGRAAELIRSFKQVAVDQSSEERRSFNVDSYLHEIIQSLKPQLRAYPNVDLVLEADADVVIDSFPGAFSQILSNLLVNALTHAFGQEGQEQDGRGQVLIRTILFGDQVRISFEDNGKGMSANVREHIFEPFFTTRRGSGGSGLGMHIVYNLVTTTLAGTIRCFSNLGEGTRFDITLPIKSETADD